MIDVKFIDDLQKTLADYDAKLVAVSKTQPLSTIELVYATGQRIFGENKVQELLEKQENSAHLEGIEWHLIGHLQRNKVKYIAPFIKLIHSIDSLSLLQEVDKRAKAAKRRIDCLLQFHIAAESSKFGFSLKEVKEILTSAEFARLKNVQVVGVMGMATFTEDKIQVKAEFEQLKQIFDELKATFFEEADDFQEISMGMSADYELALEAGSTMVRVGSKLFGKRN